MNAEINPRQLRHEAESVERSDAGIPIPGHVDLSECVQDQPRALYGPPAYVKKTGTTAMHDELCTILDDMWQCNQEHVGECTREAEAYLVLTGECSEVVQRLVAWCGQYFERRLAQQNPKDRGDPFEKYVRLLDEYNDILARRLNQSPSVAYVFLEECTRFVEWFIGNETWVKKVYYRQSPNPGFELSWSPVRKGTPELCVRDRFKYSRLGA